MNLLSIFEFMNNDGAWNQKLQLCEYYEHIIAESDFSIQRINEVKNYAIESLRFWREYEKPSFTITEVYPKTSEKDKDSKANPYFRLQGSFTNSNKRQRIACHLGMMSDFKHDKNNPELIKIAIEKMRALMVEKSGLYSSKIPLDDPTDLYLESARKIIKGIRVINGRDRRFEKMGQFYKNEF
jgi:hypothetical protein